MDRRSWLVACGAAWPWTLIADPGDFAARVAAGGAVVAFRHALAPGTYDPPGFRLEECGTQRNLNDEGRSQAQRIGAWFESRGLRPSRVRSSPWCRCLDTARLAFGQAEPWAALGSPHFGREETNSGNLAELRSALVAATERRGRFEVWVTHQFVLSALVGGGVESGEGLLLQAPSSGSPRVLARLPVPG
jgi:phosphohistidine phosphatase SixA